MRGTNWRFPLAFFAVTAWHRTQCYFVLEGGGLERDLEQHLLCVIDCDEFSLFLMEYGTCAI